MSLPQPLSILGVGAVSAAGWSINDLRDAVLSGRVIEPTNSVREWGETRRWPCQVRRVPEPPPGRAPRHPRLRRVSAVSRFAVAAAEEALAGRNAADTGFICCVTNGCVGFTNRFYHEVLESPALASPMLFPETVFNAPASHVAACFGMSGPVSTLIGDSNLIAEALLLAYDWIVTGQVKDCLIMGIEEVDWLSAEGLSYFGRHLIATEGAGALLVGPAQEGSKVSAVEGPFVYSSWGERSNAVQKLVAKISHGQPNRKLDLVDGALGLSRLDAGERQAWAGAGIERRFSPLSVLGEGMGCSGALQLALAASLPAGPNAVAVSLPGTKAGAWGVCLEP